LKTVTFGASEIDLRKARFGLLPERYAAFAKRATMASAAGAALAAAALAFVFRWGPFSAAIGVVAAGALAAYAARAIFELAPKARAASRARRIEIEFPSVVTLAYALARGGTPIEDVFRAISAERDAYPETAREFEALVRDIDLAGADLHAAVATRALESPAEPLTRFFEGLVAVLGSGSDVQEYFRNQAESALARSETTMEKAIDNAALLAEAYVSALLVLPLLLIVIISVFAAFGAGAASVLPLIVYLMVPIGTVLFLLVVEMALPPDPLAVPAPRVGALEDVGFEVGPRQAPARARERGREIEEDDPTATGAGRGFAEVAAFARAKLRRYGEATLENPALALAVSIPVALVAGLLLHMTLPPPGPGSAGWWTRASHAIVATLVVAVAPVSVMHEIRARRLRAYEGALPEALGKLSSFNERGVGVLRSIGIVGRTTTGPLAAEFRRLTRDVAWTGNFRGALRRMRARIRTPDVSKIAMLFERASRATGNLKKVIDVAQADVARMAKLRDRKRHAMASYVMVVYVVFAVFLYVVYIVADLFHGADSFTALAASGGGRLGFGAQADPVQSRLLFFHAAVVQAAASGVVAGKLGENSMLSGLKHAVVLTLVAWAVFTAGIL